VTDVNVAWQLDDVPPGAGGADGSGFACVLGSHRGNYAMPRGRDTSMELPSVAHVPMRAGDVLLFCGLAQCHGALRWQQPRHRRAVLLNYLAREVPPLPFLRLKERRPSARAARL
jgi:ectoine hydroxylase-related dioxygenase (phytanoyl-CoA dioxygenase family)